MATADQKRNRTPPLVLENDHVRTHGGAVGVNAALVLEKTTFFSYLTDPGSEVGWGGEGTWSRPPFLSLPFLSFPLAHPCVHTAGYARTHLGRFHRLTRTRARTDARTHARTSAVGPTLGSPPTLWRRRILCEAPPVAPHRPPPLRVRPFTPKRLFCLSYSYGIYVFFCLLTHCRSHVLSTADSRELCACQFLHLI